MTTNAADILIETVRDRGVEVVFGLLGDGINGSALRRAESLVRGEPNRTKIAPAVLASKVRELV